MEDNKEKNQDKAQGKQATAETDITYNHDKEALKSSATISLADFDSGGSVGVAEAEWNLLEKTVLAIQEKTGLKLNNKET